MSDIGYHRQQTCQRNVGIVSQPLSETFRKRMSLDLLRRFPILVESLNRFVLHVIFGNFEKIFVLEAGRPGASLVFSVPPGKSDSTLKQATATSLNVFFSINS